MFCSLLTPSNLLSTRSYIALLTILVAHAGLHRATAATDGWTNWRGDGQDGVAPAGEYPTKWSNSENIVWKIEMPAAGGSTPIVVADRIIVTCPVDGQNGIFCYDWQGKKLWEQRLGVERPGKHRKASGSNPSPVSDGKHVFVYFKSGDLGAFQLDGKPVWHINLQQEYGEDTLWWDLGTSPVLTSQHLVVACMQSGPSYLVALDKQTGKQVWKADRVLDAPSEASQSYSTPMVTTHEGRETIVTLGADHVTAHDALTGDEIWRVGGLNPEQNEYFRSIASPVIANDIVVAPYARGDTLTAIRLGGTGDITKSHIAWTKSKEYSSDVPTPAAHKGHVYVLTDKGRLSRLDAASGKVVWEFELEKNRNTYSASPIWANGLLYATREDGTTFVVRDGGDKAELVATNSVGDEATVATPVFTNNKILLRTANHLYCIGK